ncbi:trimeric intracellular cation channel family protein [Pseudocnuella soli]|uniref:trimeric intracellular cation channel family protein n=1 Tax=Pseudocnuella soli TaxID=2502779 RepID=UPI001046E6E5|nr:trimeric intracellular cation channel family protein [Pseudocnuella soli]
MYPSLLHVIDILGTFAFAVSGAFSAMERRFDPFGVIIIAFVTAIGGGTMRDLLVGNTPVSWLTNGGTIIVIFTAAVATMLLGPQLRRLDPALFLFDALGIGLFTIVGVEVGLRRGFGPTVCLALGTMTACFGGVLRDVMLNKLPLIFHREIYALACITGGALYLLLQRTLIPTDVAKIICIALVIAIRIIAVRFDIALPKFYLKKQP